MDSKEKLPFVVRWRKALLSENGPEKPMTRYVLDVLSKYMQPDGTQCYPSTRSIARDSGLSERAVCQHLALGADGGWIVKTSRQAGGREWRSHLYIPIIPSGADSQSVPDSRGTDRESVTHDRGTDSHDSGALTLTPRGTDRGSVEVTKEVPKEVKTRARPDELPKSVTTELWSDFVDHRKALKKPMTDKAVSMMVSKLAKLEADGHSAADALSESIIHGWQGVFTPRFGDRTAGAVKPSQRRVSPSDHFIASYD